MPLSNEAPSFKCSDNSRSMNDYDSTRRASKTPPTDEESINQWRKAINQSGTARSHGAFYDKQNLYRYRRLVFQYQTVPNYMHVPPAIRTILIHIMFTIARKKLYTNSIHTRLVVAVCLCVRVRVWLGRWQWFKCKAQRIDSSARACGRNHEIRLCANKMQHQNNTHVRYMVNQHDDKCLIERMVVLRVLRLQIELAIGAQHVCSIRYQKRNTS